MKKFRALVVQKAYKVVEYFAESLEDAQRKIYPDQLDSFAPARPFNPGEAYEVVSLAEIPIESESNENDKIPNGDDVQKG